MATFEKNLSEGNVAKQLVLFSIPFLISNVIQSFYNVADMLIVGNFSGTVSMSGVNIGGQLTFILTNIIVGLCTGGTVLIAQYLGAKDRKSMEETTATLLTALLIAGVILTVVMLILKDPILRLIQTPSESFEESSRYLSITTTGILFIFGYNVFSAILRGMGDSKHPLYFVTIACVTNIVLDLLFVAAFHMGAAGAAIATVISQALSMILCIVFLKRHDFMFDFKLSSFRFYHGRLGKILKLGTPAAIQNGITSFSFMIITVLVNVIGGVDASAAVGVVSKFNGFAIMPAVAMGASISTMCAQNIGAGRWDRAVKTCKIGTSIAFVISILIFLLAQTFPAQILELFDRNPDMIAFGVTYMRAFTFDYLLVPFCFCINGLFIGGGHTTFSLINSLLSSILLRIPASILCSITFGLGLLGVGMGAPIASFGSLLVIIFFILSGKWRVNIINKV